jgi:uncharacterized protein
VSSSPFKILSIDGGGIRGIMSAAFLAELENGKAFPLRQYFDMITGTSTGSIISLGLALGLKASDLVGFYRSAGESIFRKRYLSGPWNLFGSKYLNTALISELKKRYVRPNSEDKKYTQKGTASVEYFELEDAPCMVCVPTTDLITGSPRIFRTRNCVTDTVEKACAWEIAAASSAAPLYFPAFDAGRLGAFVDGGVWANNPAVVGIAEAIRIGVDLKTIQILSISTGHSLFQKAKGELPSGLISWGSSLVDLMFQTQSQAADLLAESLCGAHQYRRVVWELNKNNCKLDSVRGITTLEFLGTKKGRALKGELNSTFFHTVATPRQDHLTRGQTKTL